MMTSMKYDPSDAGIASSLWSHVVVSHSRSPNSFPKFGVGAPRRHRCDSAAVCAHSCLQEYSACRVPFLCGADSGAGVADVIPKRQRLQINSRPA
ncbi:hypothetical protein Y032_0836g2604 [Ancylostoma ceylanicum]|uniref:Uncharacterized protein n=1 Tax=Ancylostoma ceylanicum TaxID=53326 RepID=A0A016WBL0_9BILA|nr:hypothetical protein Y032_0836g2604 [Ancylostoma ceylanicum]